MENELLTECPAQEEIKNGIFTSKSGNQFGTLSESLEYPDDQKELIPIYSEIVSSNSAGETSEECSPLGSPAPLKKRRYDEPTPENTNGCAVNSLPATNASRNKEIIKNHFTMHLLQHVTGQQDKGMNNSENYCSTGANSESLENSISITISAPKNHSGNAKDIKKSIVDEILKKLGFAADESQEEDNIDNETRNKEANSTEKKNGNINPETHNYKGEKKTSPLIKTYARKSPIKPTQTKPPCYNSFIGATVDSNIDNEPIADSNQLLIDPPIIEQLNDVESSYHILKNVIHAQIDGSDETGYQFVPNNVKQMIDIKTEHSLFNIETAHSEADLIADAEPTPARNSIKILSNVSVARSYEHNSTNNLLFEEEDSLSNEQPLFGEDDDEVYHCTENKVAIPTDINLGQMHDFQCQYCPTKTAPAEKHYRAHYRMHFTKKGIQCPFCTYRSIKSNVVKHLFCHSPSKEFMCPLCHILKSNKGTLMDHIKIAHSIQLFAKHDSVCRSWYCGK